MRPSAERQRLANVAGHAAAKHEHPVGDGFWEGFGLPGCPPLLGMSVLEIGCGRGLRCFEAASHGAARVVGLDTNANSIHEAQTYLLAQPEAVRERVSFIHGRLEHLAPVEAYDVIISEDAFEHIMDVPSLLLEAKRRLRPGGRMYVGFGPPYHSPAGDHGWLRSMLPGYPRFSWPWGHVLFERYALRKLSKLHGRPITQTHDWPYLDLNKHTVSQYEHMFRESGLLVRTLRRNHARRLRGRVLSAISELPGLARYLTLNVYAVLDRSIADKQVVAHAHHQHPRLPAMAHTEGDHGYTPSSVNATASNEPIHS